VTVAELEARRAAVQSCAVTITIDKDPPTTHLLKFQDGKLVRSVVELPGQTLTEGYVLVRADQHATYRVNPSDKTAVRIPEAAPPAGAGKAAPPASPTSPDLQNLAAETAWAEEPVDGAPCWKVETSREGGQWTIWVDEQYGLTRKMQSGETVIQEKYDKINAVPDSAFELPPGTIVTAGGSNPPSVPPAQSAPQTPSAPPAARAAHAPPGLERR
jgi:hypothetical protein